MQATQYKLALGSPAPDFTGLKGVDGTTYGLSSFKDRRALVVVWHCNHCPYAQAYEGRLDQVARDYQPKGVGVVAINSNDATQYPEDSFPKMVERAKANGLAFPYVLDETQRVAEAYGAVCTPHVFVFDAQRALVYQGRLDGLKDDPAKGNAQELRDALDDVLAGRKVRTPQTWAFGCGVKWRKEHFGRVKG